MRSFSHHDDGPVLPVPREPVAAGAGAALPSLASRIAKEAKRYLAFATYLLVVFGTLILFSLNIYARLDQQVQHYPSYHFYALGLINALVMAKLMLIAEAAKIGSGSVGRRLRQGPLAYVILYHALLLTAFLIAAYGVEEVLVGAWHGKAPRDVLAEMGGGPRSVASLAWVMFVALIPYFAYQEFGRVLGEAHLSALPFGKAKGGMNAPASGGIRGRVPWRGVASVSHHDHREGRSLIRLPGRAG
ncbi:hypothetical protein [Methylobacterium sp. NEAU K]|uniref:hypothetical protein n=1 Tax=Methylobacterium sp. NEAU K TaxID=3064946 RepID=UPI002735D3E9|nr:hypothetical protein [Methylobacterium sp. NEAU K]MDP4002746.1 hypothetical protein [Methylobacterium sp. NEAU K]